MLKIIFIFGISLGVAVAMFGPDCNPKRCYDLGPKISRNDPHDMFPNGERLKEFCPDILAVIKCFSLEIETCSSETVEELAASDNKTIAAVANIFLGTSNLLIDICDDDTDIHKAYVENIGCFRNVVMNREAETRCQNEAREMYGAYRSRPMESREDAQHAECLSASYAFACLTEEVLKECGEEARSTAVDIAKRTKFF